MEVFCKLPVQKTGWMGPGLFPKCDNLSVHAELKMEDYL